MARTNRWTTGELAELVGGTVVGREDLEITGVAALDDASPGEITFIADRPHAGRWKDSRASAALVTRGLEPTGHDPGARALVEVDDAEIAAAAILERFAPPPAVPEPGVHPTAFVHPEARVGTEVRIGPHASVDRGAEVGDRVVLHAGVRIYAEARIGHDAVLHANVVVRERCELGPRVIVQPNATIGSDGFGYRPAPDRSGLLRVPHIGRVVVGGDAEIGANACLDRGKLRDTVVGEGTKIDNLVQIAHGVRVGRNCVLAGLSGLSGSVEVGDWVRIGGGVGISDHVRVGDGASIGARSGVMKDIPPGEMHLGTPAAPRTEALRQWAAVRKLGRG